MCTSLSVVFNYLKSDLIKKQRSFKLGLLTIFLVVLFVTLLLNVILISPIIFLKVAENQIGEADIYINPLPNSKDVKSKISYTQMLFNAVDEKYNPTTENKSIQNLNITDQNLNSILEKLPQFNAPTSLQGFDFQLLDYNMIEDKLITNKTKKELADSGVSGVTPRWMLIGNASSTENWATSYMVVLNSRKENQYNFGRTLVLENLGYLDCYVTESVFKSLKLDMTINNSFDFKISIYKLIKMLGKVQGSEAGIVHSSSNIVIQGEEQYNPSIPPNIFKKDQSIKQVNDGIQTIKIPVSLNYTDDRGKINTKDSKLAEVDFIKSFIKSYPILEDIEININTTTLVQSGIDSSQWKDLNYVNITELNSTINKFIDQIAPSLNNQTNRLDNITIPKNPLYNFSIPDIINDTTVNADNLKNLTNLLFDIIYNNSDNSEYYKVEDMDNGTPSIKSDDYKQALINKKRIEELAKNNTRIIQAKLNLTDYILRLSDNELLDIFTIDLRLRVTQIIPNLNTGKWPSGLGNVVAIDSSFGREYIIDNAVELFRRLIKTTNIIPPDLEVVKQRLIDNPTLKNLNLDNYALIVNVILSDKFKTYNQQSIDQRKTLSEITNKISESVGIEYPSSTTLTLYDTYQALGVVKSFLDNIFISIIFFLIILSFMLVYSLMLGNVEERTYEFGMLRALGYKRDNLKLLIVLQSMIFSIPAICIGLAVSGLLNIVVSYFLFNFTGLHLSYIMQVPTVVVGVYIGLVIPLFSSYAPIKSALSQNLKDSLSLFHKKLGDIAVSIVKLEKLGLSPSAILSATVMIAMGFGTYYLAPLAFFLKNITLFLFLMNLLILIMIIGMIFMFQLIVPKIQFFFVHLIMFISWIDRNVKFVVLKNLEGHHSRNQKTSIMFMIALSFTIYSGCSLQLIAGFIASATKNIFAGDIYVLQKDGIDSLDEISIRSYFDRFNTTYPNQIKGFTFISYPLNEILYTSTLISPICGYPSTTKSFFAVDEFYFDVVYENLMTYSTYDPDLNYRISEPNDGRLDIISGLYLNYGYDKYFKKQSAKKSVTHPTVPILNDPILDYNKDILVIIAEGLRISNVLTVDEPIKLIIDRSPTKSYTAKVVSTANKIPGFPGYSSYSALALKSEVLISYKQMKEVIENEAMYDGMLKARLETQTAKLTTKDNIRKQTLLLRFTDEAGKDKKELLLMELKNLVNSDNTNVINVEDLVAEAQNTANILEYLFIGIGVIALILSFFLIWTSFSSNIRDNICEFGIMRAIGITKGKSLRIYVYEALALILTSIMVGTLIGLVVSVTLVLQFNLFLELPFQLAFPFKLYITLNILAVCFSLLGSYYPTRQVNNLSLVKILKGLID